MNDHRQRNPHANGHASNQPAARLSRERGGKNPDEQHHSVNTKRLSSRAAASAEWVTITNAAPCSRQRWQSRSSAWFAVSGSRLPMGSSASTNVTSGERPERQIQMSCAEAQAARPGSCRQHFFLCIAPVPRPDDPGQPGD